MEDEISVLKSKVEANLKDIDNMGLTKGSLDKLISQLKSDLHDSEVRESSLTDNVKQLEFKIEELNEQLDGSEEARNELKRDLKSANEKTIELEEELYESKTQ